MSRRAARINVKLLVIALLATGVLGVGAVVGHYVRKRTLASTALSEGVAAIDRQDWREAARKLRIYLRQHPDDVKNLALYADANLRVDPAELEPLGRAVGAYRRLLRHRPGDAAVCHALARLYMRMGDSNETAHISTLRLEVDPLDTEAMLWLARAHAAQGNRPQATNALLGIVKLVGKAKLSPDVHIQALGLLASLLIEGDDPSRFEHARAYVDQAVSLYPDSARARMQRVHFLRQVFHDKAMARTELLLAEGMVTDHPGVRLIAAEEWLGLGEPGRSRTHFDAIVDLDVAALCSFDLDPDAFSLRRLSLAVRLIVLSGDRQAAVSWAARAMEETPQHRRVDAMPLAIELHLASGRVDAARAIVDEMAVIVEASMDRASDYHERFALLRAVVSVAEREPYDVIDTLERLVAHRPNSAPAWKMLSVAFAQTDQPRRSQAALAHLVRLDSSGIPLQLKAQAAMRQGDWEGVRRVAVELLAATPGDFKATLLGIEARIHLDADSGVDLRAELAVLQDSHPRDGHPRWLAATLALGEGMRDEAQHILEAAWTECDPSARVALALASILASDGDTNGAASLLRDAVEVLAGDEKAFVGRALSRHLVETGFSSEAIELLRGFASERPNDAAPRLALLELSDIQSDATLAQPLVDELKAIEGERGLRWRIAQAWVWLRQPGWRSRQSQIVDLLQTCVEADPGNVTAALAMGELYERLGHPDEAEPVYRRAMMSGPTQLKVVRRLLRLLEKRKRFAEAADVLARLPDDLPAMGEHRLAIALGRGAYDDAVDELRGRIAADPNDVMSRVILARLLFAVKNDAKGALALLEAARAVAPDMPAVLGSMAWLLYATDRDVEAVALLDSEVVRQNAFDAYLLRGGYYAATGRLVLAEQDYMRLPAFETLTARGYEALGRFYQNLGRNGEAITSLEAGLALAPEDAGLQRLLMAALIVSADAAQRERGRARLEVLLAASPSDVRLLFAKASVLLDERSSASIAEAKPILEEVLRRDPTNVAAQLRMLGILRRSGEMDRLRAHVAQAVTINPRSLELRLAQATVEQLAGYPVVAADIARTVLTTARARYESEGKREGAGRLVVRACNILAVMASGRGLTSESDAYTAEALSVDLTDATAQVMRAALLNNGGSPDEAIAQLEAYIGSEPGNRSLDAILALAKLYEKRGDLNAARRQIDTAEALQSGSAVVAGNRLGLLAAAKQFDRIGAKAMMWVDQHAEQAEAGASLLVYAADLVMRGTDPASLSEARVLVERALAIDDRNVLALLALARIGYQSEDYGAARSAYGRVLKLEPLHVTALNDLAWILGEKLNRSDEALALANRGVERYPNNPHLLDTRGFLLAQAGRLEDAQRDLERCVDLEATTQATRVTALVRLARVLNDRQQRDAAQQRARQAIDLDGVHHILSDEDRSWSERLITQPAP